MSAAAAVALHRNGHTLGDDFALYLRQARGVFDGDPSQVVGDNRFSVVNSGGAFSPIAYPWGWPLLLSPFVKWWGLDYDRLKLLEVATFCTWVVLVHGIVRRRGGRIVALAVAGAVATSPPLLAHTDQLLSEFPHAMAVTVFIWWFDRILGDSTLLAAPTSRLVVLGVLIAAAYNVRRESVVLVVAVAVVQLVELVPRLWAWLDGHRPSVPWRAIGLPHLAFAASAGGFQLLIPSMLVPDTGDGPGFIDDRFKDWPRALSRMLGLGTHPAVGATILVLALAGAIIAVIRRPRLNGPLFAVGLLSALAVSTHFRMVERYYFQVLPWVLYFAVVPIVELAGLALRHRPTRRTVLVGVASALPMVYLVGVHAAVLPGAIGRARDFDRAGRQQIGPTDPSYTPVYAAVTAYTAPTDVVAFFRARTMTLLTDRRTIQTTNLDRIRLRADFFAQQIGSDYYQPDMTTAEGLAAGFEVVWSDSRWILWRVPDPS
ncbi:MAG: hypothetical protein H0U21_12425 [Acidimicrobiia bacterium]|nr:hypothetical protein [Acidimicrobiia bacterium]